MYHPIGFSPPLDQHQNDQLNAEQAICIFVISTEAVCSNGTIEHAENAAAKSEGPRNLLL